MKTTLQLSLLILLSLPRSSEAQKKEDENLSLLFLHSRAQACNENGMVAAWCAVSQSDVECFVHPESNAYTCMCTDPAVCPEECIVAPENDDSRPVKSHHGITCHGIPSDEPNYVITNDLDSIPSLHHCENNALVASWCNEARFPHVSCLVLPALDEYVCTCVTNAATCPIECIGGEAPDRKTHNAIRCRGIPVDSPNYVLE
jgi:hypothetical protein